LYLEVEGGGVFVQMFEGLEAGEQRGKRGGAGRVLEEIVEFTDFSNHIVLVVLLNILVQNLLHFSFEMVHFLLGAFDFLVGEVQAVQFQVFQFLKKTHVALILLTNTQNALQSGQSVLHFVFLSEQFQVLHLVV
jgi:hypothetical protein